MFHPKEKKFERGLPKTVPAAKPMGIPAIPPAVPAAHTDSWGHLQKYLEKPVTQISPKLSAEENEE